MAGVCRTCGFFEANVWPGVEKPHRCAILDMPMTDHHANHFCPEHKDPGTVTKYTSMGRGEKSKKLLAPRAGKVLE